ncbi:hypothetical protein M407DRAFT_26541 [Tulasnella calospora MUT 4182]|uniref:Uncharacterized protein n=1 Tax=Tulasnella calospora MUT 4182 TaxID=1051891 RepID=A0A0C3Q4R0_9AGAM|nr:hypothetical protein M407DRAFT_26541 [Tulasnella calospora MUT 4182]
MLSSVNAASPLPGNLLVSPQRQPSGVSPKADGKKRKLDSYKALHVGKENIPPHLLKHLHRKGRRGSPVKVGHRRVGQTIARVPDYGASDAPTPPSEDDLSDVFM